jgi:hypothetical protein
MQVKRFASLLAVILLPNAGAVLSAQIVAPQPASSDYNLNVHVSASAYAPGNINDGAYQVLAVTIDGRHYQLQGATSSVKLFTHGNGLLNPGDYKARLTEDTHKSAFGSIQQIEFQLPDGSKRKFGVIAQSE